MKKPILMKIIDAIFEDEENVFFEPYRDGVHYGVKKDLEKELSQKLNISIEDVQKYAQEILEKTITVISYIVAGKEEEIEKLGELEKYIYNTFPKTLREYITSRHILKKTMNGPVYQTIEVTPVIKEIPHNGLKTRTFVVRVQVDKEGRLFSDEKDDKPSPVIETISFEATEQDLKEIIEVLREVVGDESD